MPANASSSSQSDSTDNNSPSVGYACPECGWFLKFEAREPTVRGAMLDDHQEEHGLRGPPRRSFRFGFRDELETDLDVQLVEDDASA